LATADAPSSHQSYAMCSQLSMLKNNEHGCMQHNDKLNKETNNLI